MYSGVQILWFSIIAGVGLSFGILIFLFLFGVTAGLIESNKKNKEKDKWQ